MIVHAEPARTFAADPHARRDGRHDREHVPPQAERSQGQRERETDQRTERAGRKRRETRAEPEREEVHGIRE